MTRRLPFQLLLHRGVGWALLLSLDCSTLPLIHTLYCWALSKEVSSTIFKVLGMTQPGIELRSPRPLVNTLPTIKDKEIGPIYKGHSIDKLNYCQRSYYLQLHRFKGNQYCWSFYISEECQDDLLYGPLHFNLFLYWRVSVFPLHWLSFWLGFIVANQYLAHL